MKTVRRLLYRDICASVMFVALAFLSLFFFIDFVDAMDGVGRGGRTLWHALQAALLVVPGHFYELFPIAVLIGTIYSLARLAQSSEFTILRTGGLGPGRALGLLAVLGVVFAVITFVTGDFIAPASEREGVQLKARLSGVIKLEGSGAWLKEKQNGPEGERSYSINVAGAGAGGTLTGVRIFEFDADGRLAKRTEAREGRVANDGVWTLSDAEVTLWPLARANNPDASNSSGNISGNNSDGRASAKVQVQRSASLRWPSSLTASVVAAAVLPLASMTSVELWRYSQHLSEQDQAVQQYKIRFWRKALYPFACLVMVALALPFAYMHARAGGVSWKVFGGIMLGISFVLLNNLSGHIGMLRGWSPWLAAAAPGLMYLLLSMAAFAWLVRYR